MAPSATGLGQLTAASIREVWPEIIMAVGRQSKKLAALASGATVRDLDGQTLVLTFRFPAHARLVAADPDLITNALYEALGGRWEIRCEVAGEAGAVQVAPGQTPRSAPAQKKAPPGGRSAPAPSRADAPAGTSPRPREAASQRHAGTSSTAGGGDDDWPEPATPGGRTANSGDDAEAGPIAQPAAGSGGVAPDARRAPATAGRDGAPPTDVAAMIASDVAQTAGSDTGRAAQSDGARTTGSDDSRPARSDGARAATPDGVRAAGSGSARAADSYDPRSASSDDARASGGGRSAASESARAAARAAAGARTGTGPRPASAGPTAPATGADWPDGADADEPPYDPDYDGPVRGAPVAYEGFDPGDEPLDDVLDEKTARQSSEQQAMQLLQDAFGAEKIGEV